MAKNFKCKKCGNIFVSDTGVCPQCFTQCNKGTGKLVLKILLSVLLVCFIVSVMVALLSAISPDSVNKQNETSQSQLTVGETLSADGLNITLQNVEDWNSNNMFIKPKEGYKFIRAYFVLENTNSTSRYLGSYDFDCYADNSKMDMSIYGDNTLELATDITGGRTLQGYIYYEVPIDCQTIEIEYGSDWWSNEKAIFKVK